MTKIKDMLPIHRKINYNGKKYTVKEMTVAELLLVQCPVKESAWFGFKKTRRDPTVHEMNYRVIKILSENIFDLRGKRIKNPEIGLFTKASEEFMAVRR